MPQGVGVQGGPIQIEPMNHVSKMIAIMEEQNEKLADCLNLIARQQKMFDPLFELVCKLATEKTTPDAIRRRMGFALALVKGAGQS